VKFGWDFETSDVWWSQVVCLVVLSSSATSGRLICANTSRNFQSFAIILQFHQ
jgi:hypothetical protein